MRKLLAGLVGVVLFIASTTASAECINVNGQTFCSVQPQVQVQVAPAIPTVLATCVGGPYLSRDIWGQAVIVNCVPPPPAATVMAEAAGTVIGAAIGVAIINRVVHGGRHMGYGYGRHW